MVFCVNFVAGLFAEQSHADVSQQSTAHDLQVRDFKQAHGQDGEAYGQHHRHNQAKQHCLFLLRGLRTARAMTAELSPEGMVSIDWSLSSPIQKSGFCRNSVRFPARPVYKRKVPRQGVWALGWL